MLAVVVPVNCGTTTLAWVHKETAQGLAPALRLAEKIAEFFLFVTVVLPARDFDLDLAAQDDGMQSLFGIGILQFQLESDGRRRREFHSLGVGDGDREVRHSRALALAIGLLARAKNSAICFHTSVPPASPDQWLRISPTSL